MTQNREKHPSQPERPTVDGGSDLDHVMAQYVEMMDRFLETQRRIVAAHYRGASVDGTSSADSARFGPAADVPGEPAHDSPDPALLTPQIRDVQAEQSAITPAATTLATGPCTSESDDGILHRYLVEPVIAAVPDTDLRFVNDQLILITEDGRGIAASLAESLKERGARVIRLFHAPVETAADAGTYCTDLTNPESVQNLRSEIVRLAGPVTGIVHLLPLGNTVSFDDMDLTMWRSHLNVTVKSLFHLAQAFAEDLRQAGAQDRGWLIATTGLADRTIVDPLAVGQSGVAGLLKTVAQEWPEVTCRNVNLDMRNPASVSCDQLINEMADDDEAVEVGYRGRGRVLYRIARTPFAESAATSLNITSDWVILITGGAVGITGLIARELAARYQPTLILMGRSPFPSEPESRETAGLTVPQDIKGVLIRTMQSERGQVTPAMVEAAYARLVKDREIRENVQRMRDAGSAVHYFQADVRDEQQFCGQITGVYETFGRLDGVIHGAGIIEDKLLESKTCESLDRVFDTKADSAFLISRSIRWESLEFAVFFASVAGAFGNRGQADYAAANEVMNNVARYLDDQVASKVHAINWGPWDSSGMVSPEVKKQFAERGIQVIPPAAGIDAFARELLFGRKGDTVVVLGGGPWKM